MKDKSELFAEIELVLKLYTNLPFTPDSLLWDDMGMDSLDIIEMVMELEKLYQISIPDYYIENMETVSDVVDVVYDLEKQKG